MGGQSADLVRREFLLAKTIDRHASLYEEVLKQTPSPAR